MKIRMQFRIILALFVLVLLAVAVLLLLTDRQLRRIEQLEGRAHDLELATRELSYLANDYLLHAGNEQRMRWEVRYTSFAYLLKDFSPADPEQAALIKEMVANQRRLKAIFSEVSAALQTGVAGGGNLSMIRTSWSRLEVQNQALAFQATRLARMLEDRSGQVQQRRAMLLFVLFGAFITFLISNYAIVSQRVLRGMADLRNGARTIGSGNLEYTLAENQADEIGELARAFNRMTADLKTVTASKTDLEREVRERSQAEDALKQSRATLEAALDSMTDAVCISDMEGRFIDFNDAFAVFHRFADKEECPRELARYPDLLEICTIDGTAVPHKMWPVPRALRGEREANAEFRLRRKGTGETWFGSYSFAPIRDGAGQLIGAVVVARDITAQKRAEQDLRDGRERLKASLEEKEVLLKEIHHRVKNNMQVVSSLVALQAEEVRDVAMHAVLAEVSHRVRTMAMVHEKLYQSADLARVDFADYARSLLLYLQRAHATSAAIRLDLDLTPLELPVNLAVPCGLILNELISNALKHAFVGRSTGCIGVMLETDDDRVRLCVRDDGIGMPSEVDWTQARTLGLRLLRMLVRQLRADLHVSVEQGTTFTIGFDRPQT